MTKMGQIVKKKKKGRPSKADLAKRRELASSAPGRELRRSHRQRSVRYTFDFDDYLDDDDLFEDFDEEEDERRREKKLKLLLKLQGGGKETPTESTTTPSQTRRVSHAPSASQSSSGYGSGDGSKPSKKRKIHRAGSDDDEGEPQEDEDDNDDVDDDENENVEHDEVVDRRGRATESRDVDSAPGTPPSGLPLPDKKILELILDKLQKKDIYGVYAEPVDPEELPDYHEVIDHPMDFSTIRKKLGNGSYSTLELFESDIFLICSNAMQYNASDTVYYKQARSIQELAKKKFEKLRTGIERSEELKSDQKMRVSSIMKKQVKKPFSRTLQDPVGSDFSSGATLATVGDLPNISSAPQAGGYEGASSVDRHVEGTSAVDNNVDKAEELLPVGKRSLSRFERKSFSYDENRRGTYSISTQAVAYSDSVLSTFEGESKQLVTVGLHTDNSYARSLARFAATLGPVAWRIASKRIEQVLPSGCKYGRGWVGEYEPLPTSVLILNNCIVKEPPFFRKRERPVDPPKGQKVPTKQVSSTQNPVSEPRPDRLRKPAPSHRVVEPTLDRKSAFSGSAVIRPTASSSPNISLQGKEQVSRFVGSDGKSSFFGSPGDKTTFSASPALQHQNLKPRYSEPQKKVTRQVELNCPPSENQTGDFVVERKGLNSSEPPSSRSMEMISKSKNFLPSGSPKQPKINGISAGGLPNGNANKLDSHKIYGLSSDVAKPVSFFPRVQDQGLTDPVLLMRMMAEKAQNQLNSSTHPPSEPSVVAPPASFSRKEDSGNASAAAARAWMSIGAGGFRQAGENTTSQKNQISADSLYNSARDLQPQLSRFRGEPPSNGMQVQSEKNGFAFHPFVPQPTRMGNDAQFQNRPLVFPQLVTTDLSRFHMQQSSWQPLSPHMQPRQKQESLPPDLNISFQSSGSPGRPSSSVLVDSQQPDLALQL
ncbi:OLC1v1022661C1 [Oldenlandia corymbosa var. corymbosa]|uniref:OLC1v1022661C1 n=1 Tax=Oldenlandia corymbosa var. corymbosa TaxID=529605 RepID=A0AAV1BYB8_OLDCO|nr:OLC1v1022661C1 [Oldenlandia corymbosa var. corymbosa]